MFTKKNIIGIIVISLLVIAYAIWGWPWPFGSSKEVVEKQKTEKPTTPAPVTTPTIPTTPAPTSPGTTPTTPAPVITTPSAATTASVSLTFNYNQIFNFKDLDQKTQNNLKKWETGQTINVNEKDILLKYEIKGYGGITMVWLNVKTATNGPAKNIFTEISNINVILKI